jgi:hypothetical protein
MHRALSSIDFGCFQRRLTSPSPVRCTIAFGATTKTISNHLWNLQTRTLMKRRTTKIKRTQKLRLTGVQTVFVVLL